MKEKIVQFVQFGKKVCDFVKKHWLEILIAIVAAFLGAVFKSSIDKHKVKTYTYGESFDRPKILDDGTVCNLADWKIRLDTIGNKVLSAGLETSWFNEVEPDADCATATVNRIYKSKDNDYDVNKVDKFFDFDYNVHNV